MNEALSRLSSATMKFARSDGDHPTRLEGLTLHRRSAPTDPLHCVYGLSLVVLLQGSKQISLGKRVFACGEGCSMLTTVDLPVVSHVERASRGEPFLALLLALDSYAIAKTAAEMDLPDARTDRPYRPLSIEVVDAGLLDCMNRLVRLLGEPHLSPHLEPLLRKEVLVRLLSGPHGPDLLHRVALGSAEERIAKAVTWLKLNFANSFPMKDLADIAHMSPSTFRQHFRRITGTSPLQFQKQLRLQEARHLLCDRELDARQAARQVGYESESQFSREYRRLFGSPPKEDVTRFRSSSSSLPDGMGASFGRTSQAPQ